MLAVNDIMTRHIDQVDSGHALGDVATLMSRARISSVIVLDGERLAGIVTERDVLHAMRKGTTPATPVATVMSKPVISVPPHLDCLEAYQLAAASGVRHLAVANNDGIPVGIVTETDFRYHLQLQLVAGTHNVASVMDSQLATLPPGASLDDALELMEDRHTSCVVVTAADAPLGIVTERDVVRLYTHNSGGLTLADVMTSPVVSIRADAPLHEAANLMLTHRIRHVVVSDDHGRLVGLLSEHGLMRPVELGMAEAVWRERRDADERLRLAASVFEQAQESIMITDASGTIVEVNHSFTAATGYSRAEAVGRKPNLLKSGREDSDYYERMWQSLVRDGVWRGEIWNRKKSGEEYAELLAISSVKDAGGEVTHYVGVSSDITMIKEHQKRLEHLAHYDALTQLPNRVLLADRMQLALAQAQRSGKLLAVGYLDLDDFKPINDSLGHEAGDQMLIEVAQRLRSCMRSGDTVSRFGGDEFALLLTDIDNVDEAERAASRILAALSAPFTLRGQVVNISASIGLTLYPHDGASPDTLLRHADQAMYLAKQAGRNRYHLYDAENDRRARAHREALERIELALEQNEFRLHFQPKVDIRHGRVVGAEALIRWQHPERGLLPPAEFLPVVEDTDFSLTLGDWVICEALHHMEDWIRRGIDLHVSVNISARQLQNPRFAQRLSELLAAHPRVEPKQLELEILETAALEDINRANTIIEECNRLGVSFALDDFGTGYSSLTYLKRLPARILKIDQSFVRYMLEDPEDLAIVEGVIGLTNAFRREVIAEGVETPQHGMLLMQLGCNLAQGYGIARPMPAEDIPAWVTDYRPDPELSNALHLSREDFPLLAMEVDHDRWIERLVQLLEAAPGTPAPVPFNTGECRFSRWYAGPGQKRYGQLQSFCSLAPLHDEVHRLADELLSMHHAGRNAEARGRIVEIHALRDSLIEQLRLLQVDTSLAGVHTEH